MKLPTPKEFKEELKTAGWPYDQMLPVIQRNQKLYTQCLNFVEASRVSVPTSKEKA